MGGPENGNCPLLYAVKMSLRRCVGGSKKPQNTQRNIKMAPYQIQRKKLMGLELFKYYLKILLSFAPMKRFQLEKLTNTKKIISAPSIS